MATKETVQKQPLHLTVIPRLDPEYVDFHNKFIAGVSPIYTLPWDPELRKRPITGAKKPLTVGKVQDYDLTRTKVRVYTPGGNRPESGWPVLIYFHSGGWTLGNISSEASFATNMCVHANCVVVYVDYRLAPENPYPAAVEDAVESLDWVYKNGRDVLGVDTEKIAVGGSSSGGNLAAVLALKTAEAQTPIPIMFQLLLVPVTDNAASLETSPCWVENQHAPSPTPANMLWLRHNYLPNKEDCTNWDASPILAPEELLSKVPKTWIAVAEVDILRDDSIIYGERLRKGGIPVDVEIYKGAPHGIMVLDGGFLVDMWIRGKLNSPVLLAIIIRSA